MKSINYVKKLVSFDTVSSNTSIPALEYISENLEKIGFDTALTSRGQNKGKATLFAKIGPENIDEGITLCGHIDVVPFLDQKGWNSNPLEVNQTENNRLVARGIADMKGFLAHTMYVANEIASKGNLTAPLGVLITSDEEIACRGSRLLLEEFENKDLPIDLPKKCLIGEPTEFEVFTSHKGYLRFSVHISGKSGHSSRPDLGVNAIENASKVINHFSCLNKEFAQISDHVNQQLFPDFPYTHANVASVYGGIADNMIADKCVINVSCRVTPDSTCLAIYDLIKKSLGKLAKKENIKLSITDLELAEPLSNKSMGLAHDIAKRLNKKITNGASYATDGGNLAKLGYEPIICGFASINQAHQPNESVLMEQYTRGESFLHSLVSDICLR